MRVTVRVQTGAKRQYVALEADGSLKVAVPARPVEGKATEAALKAIAGALGLRQRDVTLFSGATSRTKLVDIEIESEAELASRLRKAAPPDPSE